MTVQIDGYDQKEIAPVRAEIAEDITRLLGQLTRARALIESGDVHDRNDAYQILNDVGDELRGTTTLKLSHIC